MEPAMKMGYAPAKKIFLATNVPCVHLDIMDYQIALQVNKLALEMDLTQNYLLDQQF